MHDLFWMKQVIDIILWRKYVIPLCDLVLTYVHGLYVLASCHDSMAHKVKMTLGKLICSFQSIFGPFSYEVSILGGKSGFDMYHTPKFHQAVHFGKRWERPIFISSLIWLSKLETYFTSYSVQRTKLISLKFHVALVHTVQKSRSIRELNSSPIFWYAVQIM